MADTWFSLQFCGKNNTRKTIKRANITQTIGDFIANELHDDEQIQCIKGYKQDPNTSSASASVAPGRTSSPMEIPPDMPVAVAIEFAVKYIHIEVKLPTDSLSCIEMYMQVPVS